jgi:hypothetical protein
MARVVALLCTLLLAACAHATTPHGMSAHGNDSVIDNRMPDDRMPDDRVPDDSVPDDSVHHEIALPRMPAAGERVILEVELGVIGSGQEVVLRAPDGFLIGTISPYGIRSGSVAGTYAVPVAPEALRRALRDHRLRLHILMEPAGVAARAARADEVRSVRAVLTD